MCGYTQQPQVATVLLLILRWPDMTTIVFSARQHIAYMLSAIYAIERPSVGTSVTYHTISATDSTVAKNS